MSDIPWTVTGSVLVEEEDITGILTTRPLSNVEVEISGSTTANIYQSWGTVRTDKEGKFFLKKEKNQSKRKIKVKVRFADSELEINTGALADLNDFISPAILIYEDGWEKDDPSVTIGDVTFALDNHGRIELGIRDNYRQAVTWYACKTLINTLQAKDPYFAFKNKIKVIYPANVASGQNYADGITRCAYIHYKVGNDLWSVRGVLHEVMHLWNYDHNHGTANWFGAVFCPPDLSTHSQAERRPIAFHEGFAEFAASELLYELWGNEPDSGIIKNKIKKEKPYTRYALVHQYLLDNIDEVEQSDSGVFRALCVLTERAIYSHKFGDKNNQLDSDPYPMEISIGRLSCPQNPRLTIWDVLTVFQANASAGYPTEWQVGNNDYGIRMFFQRAKGVLGGKLDDSTKDLMLSLIDPNSTEEPQSRCTPLTLGSHPSPLAHI